MKKYYIATVSGQYAPKILVELAQITREYHAHWQTSKVIKLDNHFTALLKIAISSDLQQSLQIAFEKTFPELVISFNTCDESLKLIQDAIKLTIDCDDREGLTKDINQIFNNLQISVEHQENYRVAVPNIGGTVYSAKFELLLPENLSSADLRQQLEAIGKNIRINF